MAGWALVSAVVITGAVGVLVVLERRFPYDRGQRFFREGFVTDLVFYTLVQNYVLALAIAWIARSLGAFTALPQHRLLAAWPVAAQVALFLVGHDLYIYWFHRWQHNNRFLWRLHEAHHSTRDVDWLAGTRSHCFEILINQTVEFVPIVLLGAAPQVPIIKGMISAVWGMYIHSNIDVRSGRLQLLINGPEAHRWHHAVDLAPPGMNFGTKLAVWDFLFGTAYLPPDRRPTGYGLTYVTFPRGYLRQNLFAFRPLRQPPRSPPPDPSS